METLRLTNQRLLWDLEELTRQIQRPQEEQQHHEAPREVDGGGETSRAKEHDPYKPPEEDHNEGVPRGNSRGNEPISLAQEDMGGIDPAVITHRLNISPSFKPIKQKRWSFAPER